MLHIQKSAGPYFIITSKKTAPIWMKKRSYFLSAYFRPIMIHCAVFVSVIMFPLVLYMPGVGPFFSRGLVVFCSGLWARDSCCIIAATMVYSFPGLVTLDAVLKMELRGQISCFRHYRSFLAQLHLPLSFGCSSLKYWHSCPSPGILGQGCRWQWYVDIMGSCLQ